MIRNKITRDGHIHSPYCPHGTKDLMHEYIEKAIALGLEEITFTEHMPLPNHVLDPSLQKECALEAEVVPYYFAEIDSMKKKYQGKIKINKGLEVDYIEGYEKETTDLLNLYGEKLEDAILSVHILKINKSYHCVDLSPETFGELIICAGGLEKLYDHYFTTVLKAVRADLGQFKPKRIGHPTLVRVFNKEYPLEYANDTLLEELIKEIKYARYQIDFNTSGLRKPLCQEIYPSNIFLQLVEKHQIEKVYGSDAHRAEDVGSHF